MNILIVDRDDASAQLLKVRLEAMGHTATVEPVKDKVAEHLKSKDYQVVLIDPSPLNSARSVAITVRRSVQGYAYVFVASPSITQADAIKSCANDMIEKPYDIQSINLRIANAQRLRDLVLRIGDLREDTISAGGVIAKSAFNQLFLSGIDRAGRYGEKSYVLFLQISNYQHIKETDGVYAADGAAARLSQRLVGIRRQSDIIGQTAKNEFALMLQPSVHPQEPLEAAARFADTLNSSGKFNEEGSVPAELTINLIELPTGFELKEYVIKQKG